MTIPIPIPPSRDLRPLRGGRMTIQEVIHLDPRIGDLLAEAKAVTPDSARFCANQIWYGQFKPRVKELVGHVRGSDPAELRTSAAYDLVYHAVYDALPGCSRNCLCL